LRQLILTVLCLGLASYMVRVILSGLRSGRIAHSDSSSYCERVRNPVGYWLLIILFTVLAVLAIYAWLATVLFEISGP